MKSRLRFTLWLLLSLLALVLLFAHFYAPRFITEIKNPLIQAFRPQNAKRPRKLAPGSENGKLIHFTTQDELRLEAYLDFAQTQVTHGTIILLHGIRASKGDYIDISSRLAEQGFHSVSLDLRAHGNSEGIHCTFGLKEKEDISQLLDYLAQKEGLTHNIGVWGRSLGGAVALQALAHDPRLEFGIVESTFTQFTRVARDYFQHYMGFPFPLLENYMIQRAGKIAGFDPALANPLEACKLIAQPMLLIHGNEDEKIDIHHGLENFTHLKSEEKEFIEVPGAHHHDVWEVGDSVLFQKIEGFLNRVKAPMIN